MNLLKSYWREIGAFVLIVSFFITLGLFHMDTSHDAKTYCVIKSSTGIPCPACGTVRGMHLLLHGHFLAGIQRNPLALLATLGAIAASIGLIRDGYTGRHDTLTWLNHSPRLLRRWYVAVLVLGLTLVNWLWNVDKYM
jgi:hypothetical protein